MSNIIWILNRLRAMGLKEIIWRLAQKSLQQSERSQYKRSPLLVTETVFNQQLQTLKLDGDRLKLNYGNKKYSLKDDIHIFGIFDYQQYKENWHAGFQTENCWPLEFSYDLHYKQRDDIGDARTNWELNRHHQFTLIAKNYYVTADKKHLDELTGLFDSWNRNNPFLFGISWTSTMEIAIRAFSWIYTYCFLEHSAKVPPSLLRQMQTGIINMTDYVSRHYSKYSSANNHVIVEAALMGTAGILFHYSAWQNLASEILTTELVRQNYADGINKELSLHYQLFSMEAAGLLVRLMQYNQISVSASWTALLRSMSRYVSNCIGQFGEIVSFGDNDEGKILNLRGVSEKYPQYVLDLMSMILEERYSDFKESGENIQWLFPSELIHNCLQKNRYENKSSITYREGGNTILKSVDGRLLIGVDHAALGFGSIAAHGHADALSFQMFVDGLPLFIDPGTYIYHIDLENRNYFRRTANHNTVSIEGKDQSEMLGPFLWGKKAECRLLQSQHSEVFDRLTAEHNGYFPVIHKRTWAFDRLTCLCITDEFEHMGTHNCETSFAFGPAVSHIEKCDSLVTFHIGSWQGKMEISSDSDLEIIVDTIKYSPVYGSYHNVPRIHITGKSRENFYKIDLWETK